MNGLLVSELIALLEKQDGSAFVIIPWHETGTCLRAKSVVASGGTVMVSDQEPAPTTEEPDGS